MAKILVVDDSLVDQRLASKLLQERPGMTVGEKRTGLEVVTAGNGKEALAIINRDHPDLVLTDLQMPEMNGLELVDEVKLKHPALPVILMTAHGSEDIATQALQRGAVSYVPKRKLADDLLETVESVLAMSGARREERKLLDECWMQSESHFLLPNDLSYAPPLIRHLQDNLNRLKVCDENDLIRVAVALREALSNAIIHGNLGVDSTLRDTDEGAYYALVEQRRTEEPYSNRRVYVIAEESRRQAVYIVRDDGEGFDANRVPDPTAEENLDRISGRGLFLIRTFMDDVQFNAKGNEIKMIKRRGHD
jgi:CheY-like chemotaxis protein/anti-sigma regulatory factor (Ser/Thr protein kinase)